jgi:hypothetical protein
MSARASSASAGKGVLHHTAGVLTFIGPTTVLSALFYYFGYVSARSFYNYFGVTLSALEFSTTSYMVRSAGTLATSFRLLLVSTMVVIALTIGHQLLAHALSRASRRTAMIVMRSLWGLGTLAAAAAASGLPGATFNDVWLPVTLASAGGLLEYGAWVAARFKSVSEPARAVLLAGARARQGLFAALTLMCVLWALTIQAGTSGTRTAQLIERSLPLQSQAVVYTTQDLDLAGPDVDRTPLVGEDAAYRYRYNGLRPLLYSNGRWFLLPVGWKNDNGATVILLRDDDQTQVRVELAPSVTS